MLCQSTSFQLLIGLLVIITRPMFGKGWLINSLSLPFFTFISVQSMIAAPYDPMRRNTLACGGRCL